MTNIFQEAGTATFISRIQNLTPESQPQWGKMSVAQMLAHCNVTYEMIYDNKHPKPNAFTRFLLKAFVKNTIVGEKPFKRNLHTAPAFIIKDEKQFEAEKSRLINYITKTQQLGESYFDGKESHSFGQLNKSQWNTMMSKHLDHHLTQFGV
jgi:hypothetical protein